MSQAFDNLVNFQLAFLNQPMWTMVLGATVAMYAGLAAPQLPDSILRLFDNGLFRLAAIAFIMWTSTAQPTLAIVTAVAYVMALNALSGRRLLELFEGHIEHSRADSFTDDPAINDQMLGGMHGMPSPQPLEMMGGDEMGMEM